MKQIVPILLFLFTGVPGFAQLSVQVYPDDLSYDLETDLTFEFSEPIAHAWVINTSDETIELRWEREIIGQDCPAAWKYRICDDTACYSSNTVSNVLFGGGLFKPVRLPPGDSTILDLHVIPNTVAGCCQVRMNLSHVVDAQTDEFITSADFNICVSQLVSVGEREKAAIRVFPNPTTDYFTLTRNNFVKRVFVSNILGKRVKTFYNPDGGKLDVADLPDGIYLVSLVDDSNRVVKTVRLSKRSPRP